MRETPGSFRSYPQSRCILSAPVLPTVPSRNIPISLDNSGTSPPTSKFLDELDSVWAECLRILVPGGRVACVVGDVCISRRKGGRHHVLPLSADLQVRARKLGFDNLTPIRWHKVSNITLEASRSSRFLGKPNLPNGVVKNDLEHALPCCRGPWAEARSDRSPPALLSSSRHNGPATSQGRRRRI